MPRGRPKPELTLTDVERQTLTIWASRPESTQQLAQRARIVLACAEGLDSTAVAGRLGVCTAKVGKWRHGFLERRLDGLGDGDQPVLRRYHRVGSEGGTGPRGRWAAIPPAIGPWRRN